MGKKKKFKASRSPSRPITTEVQVSRSWVRHGRKKLYLFVGVLLVVVIVGAWLLSSGQSNGASTSVGQPAPDFSLQDPEKGTITKATFLGKPVIIFFTTTWCVPCQVGAQQLARYDSETADNAFSVLIVFIDDSESDSQILDWRQQFGRADWYVAKGSAMSQTYKVQYLDTKYVFDRDGIVRWVDLKPLEYSTAKAVLQPLL